MSARTLDTTKRSLISSTIVLAPDLVEMPRVVKRLRYSRSPTFCRKGFERLEQLANQGALARKDSLSDVRVFESTCQKARQLLLPKQELSFESEGERQACMWLLCSLIVGRWNLPESKTIFYSGFGFGEFWALTYRMYLTGKISLRGAVRLAKQRGIAMSLYAGERYMVSVYEPDAKILYQILPCNFDGGILSTCLKYHYIYGKKEQLEGVADYYRARLQESLPFFSRDLKKVARDYVARFPPIDNQVDSQVIVADEEASLRRLLIDEFCTSCQERKLMRVLACYEPMTLRRV